MRSGVLSVLTAFAIPFLASAGQAEESIVITATKQPEDAGTLPAAITPIDGDALHRRGATELRDMVPEASGLEVQPGGDMGPAGAVVSMQGLAEMDAYLLVQDGVPYGGTFNPAVLTLDPISVERVEVLKGPAPVSYGPTSFVGVINLIHYDAGQQPNWAMLQGGSRRSGRLAFGYTLSSPASGGLAQSLLGSADVQHFSEDRSHVQRLHLLYRGAVETGIGRLHFDLDGTDLNQRPYSPHPREGGGLSPRFPKDANVNPEDGKQNQDRLQANFGLDGRIGGLGWVTTVSFARTWGSNIRGFLRDGFATDGITVNSDGFRQKVRLSDIYLDSHVGKRSDLFDWIVGLDALLGRGRQQSFNFEYAVLPDGSNAPSSDGLPIDESTALEDRRYFFGLYGQVVARPVDALTLLAGVRLNWTVEHRCGGEMEGEGVPEADDCEDRSKTRMAGSIGGSFRAWGKGQDQLVLFADYRNTYKPAAIDFGPEPEADILEPETTRTWEAGMKAVLADGKLVLQADWFNTRFDNLVIRENIDGLFGLANAGKSRLHGMEAEAHAKLVPDFDASLTYAHHVATFVDYARVRPDGSIQQLAGNRLELSPKNVASAVLSYAPDQGVQLASVLRYTGSRFLNKTNTAVAGGFLTVDLRVGWRGKASWRQGGYWGVFLDGKNLTNRRDPVVESELGEAQFYRLSGRRILATIELDL
jgi:outer membrane receptor protein involved in Fe transport